MYEIICTNWWKTQLKCTVLWNNEKWTANNIGAEGAAKISESLMTNTTLTYLYLGCDDNIIKNKQE